MRGGWPITTIVGWPRLLPIRKCGRRCACPTSAV